MFSGDGVIGTRNTLLTEFEASLKERLIWTYLIQRKQSFELEIEQDVYVILSPRNSADSGTCRLISTMSSTGPPLHQNLCYCSCQTASDPPDSLGLSPCWTSLFSLLPCRSYASASAQSKVVLFTVKGGWNTCFFKFYFRKAGFTV